MCYTVKQLEVFLHHVLVKTDIQPKNDCVKIYVIPKSV